MSNVVDYHPLINQSFYSSSTVLELEGNASTMGGIPKILIIANAFIYDQLKEKINRYAYDINYIYGYKIIMKKVSGANHQQIKSIVLSEATNLQGVVLIGDLPAAWYEVENDYLGYAPLPNGIISIGNDAFGGCIALTSITNLNPVPVDIIPEVFEGMDQSACTLKVPAGSVSAYKNAEVWKEFNIAGIGEGIEPAEKDDFKIYPNPTCGGLRIINYELRSNVACLIVENVEIYDMSGRMVKTQCIASLRDGITTIDISHLPTGVYFLRIQLETGTVTRKVVKQ